jgi:hypothetical protein
MLAGKIKPMPLIEVISDELIKFHLAEACYCYGASWEGTSRQQPQIFRPFKRFTTMSHDSGTDCRHADRFIVMSPQQIQ